MEWITENGREKADCIGFCGRLELILFYSEDRAAWMLETQGASNSCFAGVKSYGEIDTSLSVAKEKAKQIVRDELLEVLQAMQ